MPEVSREKDANLQTRTARISLAVQQMLWTRVARHRKNTNQVRMMNVDAPTDTANKNAGGGCPGATCSPSDSAYARFHGERRERLLAYIEDRVARHVKDGGNDSPSYRKDCAYDGMRDIPGHSDHDVWNAAWQACLEHAEFLPAFAQEYRGTFTRPQTKAKVGDTVSNRRTDHRSKIVEALERSDGRIYAILESRIHCVIPSPNWEIMENA